MFFISPLFLMLMVPVMLLTLWAQWRLRSVFGRYSEVRNMQGWTGARAARALLDSQQIAQGAGIVAGAQGQGTLGHVEAQARAGRQLGQARK